MTLSGVVKMWNDDKGFGFITPDIQGGSDIFCHRSCLPTMQCMLIAGEPVTYDLDHREGRPRAANVSGRAVHDRLQYLAAPGGGGGWGQPSGAGCPPGKEAGTVRKWFDEKGFGFIGPSSGGSDIFVLRSAFGNKGGLIEGEMVFFGTAPNPKNPDKVQAAEVEGPGVTDYDMRSYGGWAAAGGGWGGVGVGGGGGGCVVGGDGDGDGDCGLVGDAGGVGHGGWVDTQPGPARVPPTHWETPAPRPSEPGDWLSTNDPTTGKTYYYNTESQVVSWDPPAGYMSTPY